MEMALIDMAHFMSGLYSLILILIGTPLNILCYYIYTHLVPNRTNPTIIVLAYLALVELLIPFTWNMNYVVRELIWKYQKTTTIKNLEQHSLLVCKFISYGAYFSLQCAAWLKTLATFARCVSVNHQWSLKNWISKPTVIRRMVWILILIIGCINFPIWIINGESVNIEDEYNQTKNQIKCYQSRFFQLYEIVHLLLYNFIPFALMILCNILLIRQVRQSRERTQRSKSSQQGSSHHHRRKSGDGGRLTRVLILITIFFIIFTSPAAIFYILGKKTTRHRNLITMSLSNLATTSHVTSFIIYWLTSSDFKDAAMTALCCGRFVPQQNPSEERQRDKGASERILVPKLIESTDDKHRQSSPLQIAVTTTT